MSGGDAMLTQRELSQLQWTMNGNSSKSVKFNEDRLQGAPLDPAL